MTWMPNFAFNHCLRMMRDEQLAGLDLSSWRILGNGSEPVHPAMLQRFAERFAPRGLDPATLTVGYGMAENVVDITLTPIVDNTGQPLPERHVGEVIIVGSSLFSGYFHDPERTAQALRAGWLHTGDLGYLADGELYILAAGYRPQPPTATLSPTLLDDPVALEVALLALAGQMIGAATLGPHDNLWKRGTSGNCCAAAIWSSA